MFFFMWVLTLSHSGPTSLSYDLVQFPNIKISISACLLTPGNKNGILLYDPITILLFAMFFASELYMFSRDNPKISLQYERYSSCVEGVISIKTLTTTATITRAERNGSTCFRWNCLLCLPFP